MFRWKATRRTYGNGNGNAGHVPISKDTHVVTNLNSPMQEHTRFWIEGGNGEQLWLETDQFRRDFERA
jgi:hypothetical protein